MKILKISLALLIGIAILIALIFVFKPTKSPSQFLPVIVGQKKIEVELADTASKRYKGLSNRSSLAQDQGLFFIFENPNFYAFTMRKMNFPIDLIWIASDQTIIQIDSNILPDSYPRDFKPISPVNYVLEVNSGWALKNNIKIKDQVSF